MDNISSDCFYCENKAVWESTKQDSSISLVNCPVCGKYYIDCDTQLADEEYRDEIASYLYYHRNEKYIYYINVKNNISQIFKDYRFVSLNEVKNFYPKSFKEKVNKILLGFADKSLFQGFVVSLTKEELLSALFAKRHIGNAIVSSNDIKNQIYHFRKYLTE